MCSHIQKSPLHREQGHPDVNSPTSVPPYRMTIKVRLRVQAKLILESQKCYMVMLNLVTSINECTGNRDTKKINRNLLLAHQWL